MVVDLLDGLPEPLDPQILQGRIVFQRSADRPPPGPGPQAQLRSALAHRRKPLLQGVIANRRHAGLGRTG